jgi:hypothetical protein
MRKEVTNRVFLEGDTCLTVRVMDGLLMEDLLTLSMKAEGYRVITGRDVFPKITRNLKDYLLRTGALSE